MLKILTSCRSINCLREVINKKWVADYLKQDSGANLMRIILTNRKMLAISRCSLAETLPIVMQALDEPCILNKWCIK
jgi:hypothetical protein